MSIGAGFVVAALCVALIDWWSVARDHNRTESLAKPLVMAALIAGIIVEGPGASGWLVVLGLSCSLIGDVLLLPTVDRFIAGLAAFLIGHVCFASGFLLEASVDAVPIVLGTSLAFVAALTVGRRIIRSATERDSRLARPVGAYIAVLCLMLASGFLPGPSSASGAVLFALSDAVLGWNRFVRPIKRGRLLTHIPYHLGQGLIALWAIGL
jgi:uncharacterized membrane protein YhhN